MWVLLPLRGISTMPETRTPGPEKRWPRSGWHTRTDPRADGPSCPQAHIYSLGATLKAALEYVAEPTLELRLSQDLEALLSRMQAEDPGDRPDLEVSEAALGRPGCDPDLTGPDTMCSPHTRPAASPGFCDHSPMAFCLKEDLVFYCPFLI